MNNVLRSLAALFVLSLLPVTGAFAEETAELMVKLTDMKGGVHSLDFRNDGRMLLSGTNGGRTQTWDMTTEVIDRKMNRSKRALNAAVYSPDGAFIVTADAKHGVRILDANTGSEVRELEGAVGPHVKLAVSPDGHYIAAGGSDKTLHIWRATDIRSMHQITAHERRITGIAFSPDGEFLCSVSEDGSMRVWEVVSGYLVFSVKLPGPLNACVFSPDGQSVAVAGDDAKIIELRTSTVVQTLKGHTGEVKSLAYSPSGKYLATGGTDHKVRLFSLTTGRIVDSMEEQKGSIISLAFSPDGTKLATGSERYRLTQDEGGDTVGENSVCVWDIGEIYTDGRIARYVERQLYHWTQQGEFEKTEDFTRRMAGQEIQAGKYFAKAYRMYADEVKEGASISNYDSTTETFDVTIPAIGHFTVRIPVEKAQTFKKRFHEIVYRNFVVEPKLRVPHMSEWTLKRVELYLPSAKQSFFFERKEG